MKMTSTKRGYLVSRKDGTQLNDEEKSTLEAWINDIRGRARTWTHDADDVGKKAAGAEARLEQAGIPMSLRPGAIMTVAPGGPEANAYGSSVRSCRYTLIRKATGWVIISYAMEERSPRTPRRDNIVLTQRQVDSLYRAALSRGRFTLPSPEASTKQTKARTPIPDLHEIAEAAESMMVTPMPGETESVEAHP